MGNYKLAAIALLVAGGLALLYGSFTYTKEIHRAKIGDLELAVKDRETVNIPVWAGVAAVLVGGLMFALPSRKR